MKLIADRSTMLNAFNAVAGVVPSKSPKAILQNVKLDAKSSEASFVATDLEIAIRRYFEPVGLDRPEAVILPARFGQILRMSQEEQITIETDGDNIRVSAGRSNWTLPGEAPALYPCIEEFSAEDYFVVIDHELRDLIRRTVFATDVNSTRYALGGVLWEFRPGQMRGVGCDGRRMAQYDIPVSSVGNPQEYLNGGKTQEAAPIVPVKALKLMAKMLGDHNDQVHISINGSLNVMIRTKDCEIFTRVVEGRFPRYQDVMSDVASPYVLTMPACDLLGGVSQASILVSEESRGVQFHFGPGELLLSSQSSGKGSSKIAVPMPGDGVDFDVTFDPAYLLPMLESIPDDAQTVIGLTGPRNGVRFDVEPNYRYVVMPLTID